MDQPEKDIMDMGEVGMEHEKELEEVEVCLSGLNFPVTKKELLAYALNSNCSKDVVSDLRNLHENIYLDLVQVERELL